LSVDQKSLSQAIDRANDALAEGRVITAEERAETVSWLLRRQVTKGRNIGSFEPASSDLAGGVHLYTGERLRTRLATSNVLTSEAARLLALFGGRDPEARLGVERAAAWLDVSCFVRNDCVIGECAHSFVSHLRFLSVSETDSAVLVRRIGVIQDSRDGKGRWERFPFYYTLLALGEVSDEAARRELRYAVPACERALSRSSGSDVYDARRKAVLDRILTLDDLRLL
jgi:hypothetical protein